MVGGGAPLSPFAIIHGRLQAPLSFEGSHPWTPRLPVRSARCLQIWRIIYKNDTGALTQESPF
jgi:hypothetical protein